MLNLILLCCLYVIVLYYLQALWPFNNSFGRHEAGSAQEKKSAHLIPNCIFFRASKGHVQLLRFCARKTDFTGFFYNTKPFNQNIL